MSYSSSDQIFDLALFCLQQGVGRLSSSKGKSLRLSDSAGE